MQWFEQAEWIVAGLILAVALFVSCEADKQQTHLDVRQSNTVGCFAITLSPTLHYLVQQAQFIIYKHTDKHVQ